MKELKRQIKSWLNNFTPDGKLRRQFPHVFTNKLQNSQDDDFNWRTYNIFYQNELHLINTKHTLKLSSGDYVLEENLLIKAQDILPLHPNHRILYETILLLKPSKLIEFGCGGGDHLFNLQVLMPHVEILGYDRAIEQLNFALERSPNLQGKITEFDLTMPFSSRLSQADVVYTQAVIMHIKTGNGHLVALANLFKAAQKQVVLMENWAEHHFENDIKFLFDQGMLPWQEIHFYIRRAPEMQQKPHLMIISAEPLPFEPLASYDQLLNI